MSYHFTLKVDRAEGCPSKDGATYYPVSDIFWHSCKAAGEKLIIDAEVVSLYDEVGINYPASRVRLERHSDQAVVGLVPK